MKQRKGIRNDDDEYQKLVSFDRGIYNNAYEQGNNAI